jgi:hypothetical protein
MTTLQAFLDSVALLCGDSLPLSQSTQTRLRLAADSAFTLVQQTARWSFLFNAMPVPDPNWEDALDTGFLKPNTWGQIVSITYKGLPVRNILPAEFTRTYKRGVLGSSGHPRVWCLYSSGTVGLHPLPSLSDRPEVLCYTQVTYPTADMVLSTDLDSLFPFWFQELCRLKCAEVYAGRHITDNLSTSFRREYEEVHARYAISQSRNRPSAGKVYGSTF